VSGLVSHRRSLSIAACVVLAVAPPRATAQGDDALGRAMRDEVARSMKELRFGQFERPYFIAYRVREARLLDASAVHGSLLNAEEHRLRTLATEVRVGDYRFDNTNFFGGGGFGFALGRGGRFGFVSGDFPLDDDYREFRRKLWVATDAEYKQALETIAEKRAALLNRSRGDSLPDFTRETPSRTVDEVPPAALARANAEALVRELSGLREFAHLDASRVTMTASHVRIRFLNSEGTTFVSSRPVLTVAATASTQATDGQPIGGSIRFVGRSVEALPSRDALVRAVRSLAAQLDSLQTAPVLERYNGPVLFEGRAAAELFAEVFAPAFVGRRPMQTGEPAMARMFDQGGRDQSFTDKIGRRVLPDFLSVVDDPTTSAYRGESLLGAYTVDDDGVLGRRKTLVDAGILKSLLTTRTPVEGVQQSGGNRRGEGAAPSNVIVEVTRGVNDAELKAQLLAIVKRRGLPYGVIVRELGSRSAIRAEDPMSMFTAMRGRGAGGRPVFRAYRVYPDGGEQLVRGAQLDDLDAQSFKDIVAVSSTPVVYHRFASSMGSFPMPAMWMMEENASWELPIASYVVPSLLFEDVTFVKPAVEQPKRPLSRPPGVSSR
jgi:predicted Zn-dependent protease